MQKQVLEVVVEKLGFFKRLHKDRPPGVGPLGEDTVNDSE